MSSSSFYFAPYSSASESLWLSLHQLILSRVFCTLSFSSLVNFSLSFVSLRLFLTEYVQFSSALEASIFFLAFSSASLNLSASSTNRLISSFERRPFQFVIVILFDREVPLSVAVTLRIPFSSISKETSICGTPRGAGAIPSKLNFPSKWLSFVSCLSPSKT